jgi:ParB/RepB/Spo0J family partition protein
MANATTAVESKKTNGHTHDQNQIINIPLADIHVDYTWNSRTGKAAFDYAGKVVDGKLESDDPPTRTHAGGSTGFPGLVMSLKVDGQDTPVVVRPTPDHYKTSKKPYTLTVGFRRFKAIEACSIEGIIVKGNPAGTIRAQVVSEDETSAFRRNLRENSAREDLTGPDLVFGVRRLLDGGAKQVELADELNKSSSYISQLANITDPKDGIGAKKILDAWKDGKQLDGTPSSVGRLAITEMLMIAKLPKDKQAEKYAEMTSAISAGPKVTKKNAWRVNAQKKAEAVGAVFAIGVFFGVIEKQGLTKKLAAAANDFVPTTCPKKKGMSEKQRDNATEVGRAKVAESIVKGFEEGLIAVKVREEERARKEQEMLEDAGAEEEAAE